jgi:hypothetical protein
MSKNLTRKGLAFGALVALGSTAIAGSPANALVNDAQVSLTPTAGTSYTIVQDNTFDVKSDQSLSAVAGSGNLKFKVTDADSKILFDYDGDTATNSDTLQSAVAITDIAWTDGTGTTLDTVTLTTTETGIAVGDVITVSSVAGTTDGSAAIAAGVLSAINTSQVVSATGSGVVSFKVPAATFAASVAASAATASAGTFTELTKTDALDTRAVITNAAATIGVAGLTGLTAPTRAADGSFVVDTGASDASKSDVLRLVSTAAAGTSATATVTAWIDENADGVIDSTEDSSSTRTIVFTPWANAGAALTFTQPVAGLATYGATVAFGADINAKQITAGRLTVGLGLINAGAIVAGTAVTTASSGAFTAGNLTQWNDTNGNWEAHVGGTAGVAHVYDYASGTDNVFRSGTTYAAQILVDGAVYGSAVYKAISASVADAVGYVGATRGANVKYDGTTGVTVRSGTKSVDVSAKATLSSVAVAGAPVTVTVSRSALDTDSTITVNSKTFTKTSTTSSISYDTVTGADGKVVVSIANSQGKASDAVTVTVVHAGISSTATTISWADVDHLATKFDESANINNSIRNIAKGGSFSITYNVADEFGAAPTTDWRVKAVYTPLGTSQTQVVKSIPVTAGVATLAVTDASTATGSYNVVAYLQKLNTSTGNYDDVDPAGGATTINMSTAVYVGSASVPATATLTVGETTAGTAGAIDLEAADFESADRRVNANQAANAYSAAEYFAISGLITDASGVAVPGAVVTIKSDAGNAVTFLVDGVATIGSATVVADASGNYASVKAFSHKAGDIKFTATSGAATKTADAVQARNASTAAAVVAATIGLVQKLTPGYTTTVKITVLDKWGNAVKQANGLTVAVSGIGYAASLPTAVSATDGSASFTLITLPGERGISTVTVTAAADSASTDDVTVTKSVLVGVSAKITKPAKGATAVVKGAAGATIKVVRGTKSVTKAATSNSQKVVLKSGTGTVTVYVNGVKIAAK